MKRFTLLIGLCAIVAVIMAAAPLPRNFSVQVTGATAIDSQWTADAWDSITNIIYVASDSANVIITATGTAVMSSRGRLYLGFSALDADSLPELDTLYAQTDLGHDSRKYRIPFSLVYPKLNDGALTDTIFIVAAKGGRGGGDAVTIEDLVVTAVVADQ